MSTNALRDGRKLLEDASGKLTVDPRSTKRRAREPLRRTFRSSGTRAVSWPGASAPRLARRCVSRCQPKRLSIAALSSASGSAVFERCNICLNLSVTGCPSTARSTSISSHQRRRAVARPPVLCSGAIESQPCLRSGAFLPRRRNGLGFTVRRGRSPHVRRQECRTQSGGGALGPEGGSRVKRQIPRAIDRRSDRSARRSSGHLSPDAALRPRHIGRHSVLPEEFEEVCFGDSFVLRAKSTGKNPVYYVLGQTEAGRHLLCVVVSFRRKGVSCNCPGHD